MLRMKMTLILALVLLLVPGAALATSELDFSIDAPSNGLINYAGGAAVLTGSNIVVTAVTGVGTPLNDGVTVNLVNGLLNFSTGANTGGWSWAAGGTLSITETGGFGPLVLLGSWNSASIIPNGAFGILGGTFTDDKNPALMAFYGLSAAQGLGVTGTINLSVDDGGQAVGTPLVNRPTLAGDLINNIPGTVPEPASLALMGSGLIGIAGMARRKLFS